MNRRPTGLTVFAVINFIFAGVVLLGFVVTLLSTMLPLKTGEFPSAYRILSPLVTAVLLVASGIGFLKLSYRAGFVGGIVLCVLSLGNVIVFNALRGFSGFLLHIPSMVYPTLLLLMLTLRYRTVFARSEGTIPEGADPPPSTPAQTGP